MIRTHQAALELERVASMSAFNVQGATGRRLNQHATLYSFPDGSRMLIRQTGRAGDAWHPAWTGGAHDVHLGPVMGRRLFGDQ